MFVYIIWHMVSVNSDPSNVLKICGSTGSYSVWFCPGKIRLDFYSYKQLSTEYINRNFE